MILTRISKGIRTRRRQSGKGEDDCKKNRQSDINEANRQGEEYHKEVKIQGEENCDE